MDAWPSTVGFKNTNHYKELELLTVLVATVATNTVYDERQPQYRRLPLRALGLSTIV